MRNEKENQIFNEIRYDDVKMLKSFLQNPVGCRLGDKNFSILSVAVLKGACDVIKYLIDQGCDSGEIDKNGNTLLHLVVSEHGGEKSKQEIVEILLATYSNAVEAVFSNVNLLGMTPFLLACHTACHAVILHFLSLLEKNSISVDKLIGFEGDNLFHFLLHDFASRPHARLDTLLILIDKVPQSNQLLDARNDNDATPLQTFFRRSEYIGNTNGVAKIFFHHGASPDDKFNNAGLTFLDWAIQEENESLIEILLRAGCLTRKLTLGSMNPLSFLLRNFEQKSKLIRMIELFLAFGYDLQKELYLYTIDELPIEYAASPKHDELLDTTGVHRDILKALRELRRSNKMLSLQRQCRNTIRRHLKGKADEVIRNLTCIPDPIKSFLLVENEMSLLQIPK